MTGFYDLPYELIYLIFEYVRYSDIVNLFKTCNLFRFVISECMLLEDDFEINRDTKIVYPAKHYRLHDIPSSVYVREVLRNVFLRSEEVTIDTLSRIPRYYWSLFEDLNSLVVYDIDHQVPEFLNVSELYLYNIGTPEIIGSDKTRILTLCDMDYCSFRVSGFTGLEELTIAGGLEVILDGINSPRVLKIEHVNHINLPYEVYKDTEVLHIVSMSELELFLCDINSENLKELRIETAYLTKDTKIQSTSLEYLELVYCQFADDFDFTNFSNAKHVKIETTEPISSISWLGNQQSLKLVTMGYPVIDWSEIDSLRGIPDVIICNAPNLEDVSALADAEKVTLIGCKNLKDTSVLVNVKNLRIS